MRKAVWHLWNEWGWVPIVIGLPLVMATLMFWAASERENREALQRVERYTEGYDDAERRTNERWQNESVEAGHAEWYLDADHQRQWRWKPVEP